MSRTLGTVVRGVRAPIFREGDNVVQITADTVLNALKDNGITARDGDIVAITESVVALPGQLRHGRADRRRCPRQDRRPDRGRHVPHP